MEFELYSVLGMAILMTLSRFDLDLVLTSSKIHLRAMPNTVYTTRCKYMGPRNHFVRREFEREHF